MVAFCNNDDGDFRSDVEVLACVCEAKVKISLKTSRMIAYLSAPGVLQTASANIRYAMKLDTRIRRVPTLFKDFLELTLRDTI